MRKFGLQPLKEGYSFNYRPDLNPGILSAFSTAAYRLHTLVASFFDLRTEDDQVVDRFRLSDTWFDPSVLYKRGAFDLLINGLVQQPTDKNDQYFSEDMSKYLFGSRRGFGMDIVALNIQRGRDHGIPGYNKWRELCGLRRIQDFRDLANVMSEQTAQTLSRLYGSVDDIDLFVAGTAERPMRGAMVGPTFGCILAEQFRRLKEGDRLWYENGNIEFPFSQGKKFLLSVWRTNFHLRSLVSIANEPLRADNWSIPFRSPDVKSLTVFLIQISYYLVCISYSPGLSWKISD